MLYIRYEKNYLWFPMEGEILEFNVAANINAIFLAIRFDFIFQNNTSEIFDFCLTFFSEIFFYIGLVPFMGSYVRLTICGNEFIS